MVRRVRPLLPRPLLRRVLAPVLTAAAAGLTTWAAFPPVGQWPAALLGVGGLMALTRGRSLWAGSGLGLVYGIGLFTPLLHFVAVAMGNAVGWAALTAFEALYLAALGGSWALVARLSPMSGTSVAASLARVLAFTLLWGGAEALRSSWPLGGFPFGRLAFAMADAPMLPVAAYGGSLGLSLVAAAAGACLADAVTALLPGLLPGGRGQDRRLHQRGRVLQAAAAASGAVLLVVAPGYLASLRPDVPEEGSIRVGAVQGNVAEDFEDAFGRALEVAGNHARATHQLASDTGAGTLDLVVWPENAADLDPRSHAPTAALVEEASRAVESPLLVGAVSFDGGARYNDVLVWTPGEGAGDYYRKHRPVPFGEYVPARDLVRRLSTQVDRISTDMLPGTGAGTLTVRTATQDREVVLAMGICFEVAYDDTLRDGVRQGGQLIVIPTNNASFLHSGEAAQQLAQGRVQAVVHGRSLVQVSTVGYTAVISPDGTVEQVAEPYTQVGLVADVGLSRSLTVADRAGQWPARLVLSLSAALALAGIVGAVRQRAAVRRTGR